MFIVFRVDASANIGFGHFSRCFSLARILKKKGAVVGLADGMLFADNKPIYEAESLKVGLFKS